MIGRRGEDDSGKTPLNVGKDLDSLGKAGLARKPNEKQPLWLITDNGRKYIENPPVVSGAPSGARSRTPSGEPSGASGEPSEEVTIPSQADLFMAIGERLGIGVRVREQR